MNELLDNPVFHALLSGDASLAHGTAGAKYFDEQVSPFAGFDESYGNGFDDLHQLLPAQRKILYATRRQIGEPKGWELLHAIEGLQFIHTSALTGRFDDMEMVPLTTANVEEMIQLTTLTKPGPFGPRTIEFGHYFGIFKNNRLAAMAGQRLHPGSHTEISAVCTHPDFLGKGYAAALIRHQLHHIRSQERIPFLHVRGDNSRAIALYERLGFVCSGPMNFYVLKHR